VVNPSGGLISKGHPLGATGLAQCTELVWQLRGWCGKRQVPNVRYALQHNVGLGGAVVISIYKKGFPSVSTPKPRFSYNPAVEARPITEEEFKAVQPKNSSLISSTALSGGSLAVAGFESSSLFEQIKAGLESAPESERKGLLCFAFLFSSLLLYFSLFLFFANPFSQCQEGPRNLPV